MPIGPVRSLRPYLWRALLPFLLIIALARANIVLGCVLGFIMWKRHRWVWRLVRHVRRFHTTHSGSLVLHYDPGLNPKQLPGVLRRCQRQLNRLADRFGKPLNSPTTVFLLASHREISRIMGYPYGGFALWNANAIVIAADDHSDETISHEFTHLFSGRWSILAPALLCEGLSVCLQENLFGHPIDSWALLHIHNRNLRISHLLKANIFFSEDRAECYILAGSFVRFLIRRYGWERFEKLYRSCNEYRLRAKFKKHIGVTLERAEWSWRNDLTVPAIIRRRMSSSVA